LLVILALVSGIYLLTGDSFDIIFRGGDPVISEMEVLSVNRRDGARLITVPGGIYPVGDPPVMTRIDSFYIYLHEVTNRQYAKFVEETGYKAQGEWYLLAHEKTMEHPVCEVSFEDARAYARWAGGDLPSRIQWEASARGKQGRIYPWGNEWDPDLSNNREMDSLRHRVVPLETIDGVKLGTLPVGSFPDGRSPFGVLDMAGNVAEWCLDIRGEGEMAERVLMGGSFFDNRQGLKTHVPDSDDPRKWCNLYGFRVVINKFNNNVDKQYDGKMGQNTESPHNPE